MKKSVMLIATGIGVAVLAGFVFLPAEPLPPGPAIVAVLSHFLG